MEVGEIKQLEKGVRRLPVVGLREMGTRTWLFGEGRIDPSVVEMNLRCGQLKKQTVKAALNPTKKTERQREKRCTHDTRNANHISSYGGSSSPSHTKHLKTSNLRAAPLTADETAYPSGSTPRPHPDVRCRPTLSSAREREREGGRDEYESRIESGEQSGKTLSARTWRARAGRAESISSARMHCAEPRRTMRE